MFIIHVSEHYKIVVKKTVSNLLQRVTNLLTLSWEAIKQVQTLTQWKSYRHLATMTPKQVPSPLQCSVPNCAFSSPPLISALPGSSRWMFWPSTHNLAQVAWCESCLSCAGRNPRGKKKVGPRSRAALGYKRGPHRPSVCLKDAAIQISTAEATRNKQSTTSAWIKKLPGIESQVYQDFG